MRCLALRHIACEDLGTFEHLLRERFKDLRYIDMIDHNPPPPGFDEITTADLVVSLGGPMAVYEAEQYPFIQREVQLLARRIAHGQPTLGICLGSQIMAAAAGARVYGGGRQEIGWYPLELTPEAAADPVTGALAAPGDNIFFHWHGDTFDIPAGARLLGSSALFPHQGFTIGRHAIALQAHVEIDESSLHTWLATYGGEPRPGPGVMSREALLEGARRHGAALTARGQAFLKRWLAELWP